MVCRWVQEILRYHLTIVHISNTMMVYVDALTWRFVHLISYNITIASLLRYQDRSKRPCAYADTKLSNHGNAKITETDNPPSNPPPFLTSDILHRFSKDSTTHSATASSLETSSSPSIKILPIHINPSSNLCTISPLYNSITPDTTMAALQIHWSLKILCLCINAIVGSYTNWGRLHGNRPISWSLQNYLHILPS